MTADFGSSIRASRNRVPRSRGATSGALLLILGAWAALIPFIGPYLNLAYTPSPNKAWDWTSARGWLEVLPGAAVVLGALLLLFSTSRVVTLFGGWLAAAGGAWLIVSPALAETLKLDLGTPDPASRTGVRALVALLFFYGIGALILFLASVALGRLSVHSIRDVRAAERRVAAEEEAAAQERRAAEERRVAEERNRTDDGERGAGAGYPAGATAAYGRPDEGPGRHEFGNDDPAATRVEGRPVQGGYPAQPGQPSQPGQPTQTYAAAPPPPPEQRR
jgi:hypothetical protein